MAEILTNTNSASTLTEAASQSMVDRFRYSYIGYPFWQYWIDIQDPRTADFPLVNVSPYTFLAIMGCYVYFAKSLGPRFMQDRKPYSLKWLMFIYNVTMCAINAYFVRLVILNCDYGRRFMDLKFPERIRNAQTMWELNMAWWYWMSKFADLLDTVFFVLRKKDKTHISFLHLYHHTVVPIFGYLCLKQNAIMPATAMFALINGTIHVFMYSYYALAAMGPAVQKYLWWKKYITQMQLGQFVFGMFYGILMVFKAEGYPVFWFWFGLTQPFFFFKLFYDFYKKSYTEKKIQ